MTVKMLIMNMADAIEYPTKAVMGISISPRFSRNRENTTKYNESTKLNVRAE